MGKIDIVIYILLLIMIFIGFSKGIIKQVLSTANWLVSLIGAFVLVKPFSKLMMKTPINDSVNKAITDWIATKGTALAVPYDPANSNEQIADAISQVLKLPKFIASIIAKGINISSTADLTLAEVLAPSITSVVITVLSFIALFIILLIVLKIIINLLNLVFDSGVLGLVNKLLGAALGLVKGALIISLIMLLVSVLSGVIPSLNEFLITDLKLGVESFSIGKYFYEKNPLLKLIEGSFSFDNLFSSIFS